MRLFELVSMYCNNEFYCTLLYYVLVHVGFVFGNALVGTFPWFERHDKLEVKISCVD